MRFPDLDPGEQGTQTLSEYAVDKMASRVRFLALQWQEPGGQNSASLDRNVPLVGHVFRRKRATRRALVAFLVAGAGAVLWALTR